jgi:hypothetical protein
MNFIKIDSKSFAKFFIYTPVTIVLPIQIIFYILIIFFRVAFIFELLSMIIILIIISCLQKIIPKYQLYALEKKVRIIKTTTQDLNPGRSAELKYFKKIKTISIFMFCIFDQLSKIMYLA